MKRRNFGLSYCFLRLLICKAIVAIFWQSASCFLSFVSAFGFELEKCWHLFNNRSQMTFMTTLGSV